MAEDKCSGDIQRGLECTVCLRHYNLTDRLPKALKSCFHSICQSCITNLIKDSSICCPECRAITQSVDVATNYGIKNILEKVCESCANRERFEKCYHCDQQLCTRCLEEHAKQHFALLTGNLDDLQKIIKTANDLAMDNTEIMEEETNADQTVSEIKVSIQHHRDMVDQLERELELKVQKLKCDNVEKHIEWKSELEAQTSKAKQFSHRARSQIGIQYKKNLKTESMAAIQRECSEMSTKLTSIQNNLPRMNNYCYQKPSNTSLPDLGNLVCKQTDIDAERYKLYVHKNVVGSEGSGSDEFHEPAGIACTVDRLFVTDASNHRLKCYDLNLKLLYIVGQKGSGLCDFKHPLGVAAGQGDEVFVSDCLNHRIKVYSKNGEVLMTFGTKGKGNDQFEKPGGIAVHHGLLYICDKGNHRVKVTETNGSFVHSIGSHSQGPDQFQSEPLRVAVTSDGRVMVIEHHKQTLHVFSPSGQVLQPFPRTLPSSLGSYMPRNIALDQSNNAIIGYTNNQLIVLNRHGDFVCTIEKKHNQPQELKTPRGLAVDRQGNIYVDGKYSHNIHVFGRQ